MRTEFFMPMENIPTTTHQQKKVTVKNGRKFFYEPAELKAAHSKLEAHLAQHVPENKYNSAIRVVIKWCFKASAKYPKGTWKTTTPDCDNLCKLFLDCCTDVGFWEDDKLIASLVVEKFYSDITGIYVCIEELVK